MKKVYAFEALKCMHLFDNLLKCVLSNPVSNTFIVSLYKVVKFKGWVLKAWWCTNITTHCSSAAHQALLLSSCWHVSFNDGPRARIFNKYAFIRKLTFNFDMLLVIHNWQRSYSGTKTWHSKKLKIVLVTVMIFITMKARKRINILKNVAKSSARRTGQGS